MPLLNPIKAYILGTAPSDPSGPAFVFWAPSDAFELPPTPSPFAHQVLLGIESGAICARIRFFGAYDFMVQLGQGFDVPDACRLFVVDPLASGKATSLKIQTGVIRLVTDIEDLHGKGR